MHIPSHENGRSSSDSKTDACSKILSAVIEVILKIAVFLSTGESHRWSKGHLVKFGSSDTGIKSFPAD